MVLNAVLVPAAQALVSLSPMEQNVEQRWESVISLSTALVTLESVHLMSICLMVPLATVILVIATLECAPPTMLNARELLVRFVCDIMYVLYHGILLF